VIEIGWPDSRRISGWAFLRGFGCQLEGNDYQARYQEKVLRVECGDIVAEMEGGRADYEVFKGYGDAIGGLFAFDLASELGDFEGDRMHEQILECFFAEDASPFTVIASPSAIDAVCQFDDTDRGDGDIFLPKYLAGFVEDVLNGVAAAFAGDQDAGVEQQAQGISPRPIGLRACDCG